MDAEASYWRSVLKKESGEISKWIKNSGNLEPDEIVDTLQDTIIEIIELKKEMERKFNIQFNSPLEQTRFTTVTSITNSIRQLRCIIGTLEVRMGDNHNLSGLNDQ